jgi:tetratricopeptide (TPR) repeat protein
MTMRSLPARAVRHGSKFLLLCLAFGNIMVCAQERSSNTTTSPPMQHADVPDNSHSPTSDEKLQAQQLFSTGFGLWQSGDFESAAKAFKRGLSLDPRNIQANYYLGECLRKTNHREEAKQSYSRVVALGANTPEGFKAATALEQLAKPATPDEMTNDELIQAFVGTWKLDYNGHEIKIYTDPAGKLQIKGSFGCFPIPPCIHYVNLSQEGNKVHFSADTSLVAISYSLQLVSQNRMTGEVSSNGKVSSSGATKK